MARREYARIGTDMPDEPTIRALDVGPQWLYDRLLLRAEMSRCGVVPLRPLLWAELAADATEKKVRGWLRALTVSRHVVLDERYAEALIRTFVRHDGLLSQPNVVANMCSDFRLIASDALRLEFLREFRRIWDLPLSPGERGGWLLAVGCYPDRKAAGKDDRRSWPEAITAESHARLTKAIGTGLRDALTEAITEGLAEPFDKAHAEGLPEALTEPPIHARDRGESRAPIPSAYPERRATSAYPGSRASEGDQSNRPVPGARDLGLVDHDDEPRAAGGAR